MRQYKIFVLVLQVIVSQSVFSGFDRISQPTETFSKAFSGVALFAPENITINPAASARVNNFFGSMFYSPSPFQLHQLSNSGILFGNNFSYGNICFIGTTFGFELYRESSGSINYSHSITNDFAFGISLNVNHLAITSYGSDVNVGLDVGLIFSPIQNLFFGTSVNNINRPKISSFSDEIPVLYNAGIAYSIAEIAVVNIDLTAEIRRSVEWKFGVEYTPIEFLIIRAGYNDTSRQMFSGIGVAYGKIQFNYGIALHNELGATHSIGISLLQ